MATSKAPKVFISHASEDKERFVTRFATALRAAGIDAWVDEWEIRPGDSLVTRIFDEGLAGADAFIVVLSATSVTKPWVKEELDAAVVRRIESGQERRLIPVVLDDGVDVPAPLKHVKWESVPKDGFDGVMGNVVSVLHGSSTKPPLGAPPAYVSTPLLWTSTAADETVFRLVVDEVRAYDGPGWRLVSDGVRERALTAGISKAQFEESMAVLDHERRVNVRAFAGGVRWQILPFDDRTWLALEQERGVDIDALHRDLLIAIVNDSVTAFAAADLGIGHHVLGAVLRSLRSQRLIANVAEVNDGRYFISGVSPLAARALRDLGA